MNILIINSKIQINVSATEYEVLFNSNPKLSKSRNLLKRILTGFIIDSSLINYKILVVKKPLQKQYLILLKPFSKKLYCYKKLTLEQINKLLHNIKNTNTTNASLYYKEGVYYLLSYAKINDKTRIYGKQLKNVIEEYTQLISTNAIEEILPLL